MVPRVERARHGALSLPAQRNVIRQGRSRWASSRRRVLSLTIAYVPWAALFSETLEEISPAPQATGWAFFGLVARLWVAISAPLMLFIAARHGWGTWMWVCLGGVICYIASLVLVHARSAVTFPAAEAGQTVSA